MPIGRDYQPASDQKRNMYVYGHPIFLLIIVTSVLGTKKVFGSSHMTKKSKEYQSAIFSKYTCISFFFKTKVFAFSFGFIIHFLIEWFGITLSCCICQSHNNLLQCFCLVFVFHVCFEIFFIEMAVSSSYKF